MKIKLPVVISMIFIVGIFLFYNNARAENSDIIINEIGAYEPDSHEWVEIFNRGLNNIDLTGWKFIVEGESAHGLNLSSSTDSFMLGAGEYGVIAENADNFKIDYPMCSAKIYDTANFALNESGNKKIGLRDNNSVDLEYFNYPEAPNFSLERVSASVGAGEMTNWKEHESGNTVGAINYWTTYTPPAINQNPLIIINGPTSTEVGTEVQFDGSDSSDPDGTVDSYQWTVGSEVVGASSSLNYIFANAGNFIVNLLVTDNQGATSSASLDFVVNEIATSTDAQLCVSTTTYSNIYLNEFLPDPSTSTEHEWIELYNPNTSTVNLTGWTLSDSITIRYSPTGTISASGYYIIEFNNILNNTGDTIILKNPAVEVVDSVVYGNSNLATPAKGNTIARSVNGAGSWQETTTVTKNQSNIITAPVVEAHQSSSSGSSQTNNSATVIQTTYLSDNENIIINELFPNPKGSDTENEFIELKNIGINNVNLQNWVLNDSSGSKYIIKSGTIYSGGFMVLKRAETNIALNNSGEETIKLLNPTGSVVNQVKYTGPVAEAESWARKTSSTWEWTVKATPGTENVFENKNLVPIVEVSYSQEVSVGETAVFDASDSADPEGGKLNFVWSTGDEEKNGEIVSFVFDRAGKRVVNLKVVDDHNNQVEKKLSFTVVRDEDIEIVVQDGVSVASKSSSAVKSNAKKYSPLQIVSLANIKNTQIGDNVRVSGVVVVEPGILGSQYFYIVDSALRQAQGSLQAGVQVYSNKKDFPNLKIGDKIQVTGEISEVSGEKRIKTKTKADMKKLSAEILPVLKLFEISEINEDFVGSLAQIQGEITELKSTYFYLDDGTEEIKASIKKGTGINVKNYQVGEVLQVSGIISQTKAGLQILPRADNDLEKIVVASSTIVQEQESGNSANVAETYLTATAGGLSSILIGLFAKARGRFALGLIKKAGTVAVAIIKRNPKV